MPRLSLSLLGPKQILLEDKPVRAFTYHKALALLAYLAIEADVPHSRQELVGLLWPDLPHTAALTNLRQVLADLRQAIADETAAPPFLLITRESIQFNVDSDFQLDITSFLQLALLLVGNKNSAKPFIAIDATMRNDSTGCLWSRYIVQPLRLHRQLPTTEGLR